MNKATVITCSLVLLTLLSACGNSKKLSKDNSKADSTAAVTDTATTSVNTPSYAPLSNDSVAVAVEPAKDLLATPAISPEKVELANSLLPFWNRTIEYNTFAGKAKMHYEGTGMNYDFTGNFRMLKDSAIWIHISAGMGLVNVGRVLVTQDSFFFLNYLDKSIMEMPVSEVGKLLPAGIDFATLQNLIIGTVLNTRGQPVDANIEGDMARLKMQTGDIIQEATFAGGEKFLRTLVLAAATTDYAAISGKIEYDRYNKIAGRDFATERVIDINEKGKSHHMEMTFNSARFDEPVDFPFSKPADYTRK